DRPRSHARARRRARHARPDLERHAQAAPPRRDPPRRRVDLRVGGRRAAGRARAAGARRPPARSASLRVAADAVDHRRRTAADGGRRARARGARGGRARRRAGAAQAAAAGSRSTARARGADGGDRAARQIARCRAGAVGARDRLASRGRGVRRSFARATAPARSTRSSPRSSGEWIPTEDSRRGREPMPDLETSLSYCTYCPKLCRHTCPVSNAETRETLVPQTKMATMRRLRLADGERSVADTEPLYGCTGCGACTEACLHKIAVGPALFRGRQEAEADGRGHPALAGFVKRFEAHSLAAGAELRALVPASRRPAEAQVAFMPGCEQPSLARPMLELCDRVGAEYVAVADR